MSKKISKERYTIEHLMETYSQEQLSRISRFAMVNDIEVLTKDDMEKAINLSSDSSLLDSYYHLPKGLKAPINKFYWTTDFDCPCTGLCNITDINKTLIKALYNIRLMYRYPVKVVKGYVCSSWNLANDVHSILHTKGQALTLQTSDNDRLYKVIDEGKYSYYSLGIDDNFVYLNMELQRDDNNNIDPKGYRWDNRSTL